MTAPTQQATSRHAVILTALPIECQAVLDHLQDTEELTHPSGSIYWQGRFTDEGNDWTVTVTSIGAQNESAAVEAERAIQHFNPSVALFVGVAGGLKDVSVGDVVAASHVYGYESGKDEKEFKPRPNVGESSHALTHRARAEAIKGRWVKRIISPSFSTIPKAFPGPIAAGAKVVASMRSPTYMFLRKQYSDALAVEMEGRGFLTATHANQHVYSLVLRGISDCIDGKSAADASGSQAIASRHVSAFAFEVLARFKQPSLGGVGNKAVPKSTDPVWTVNAPRNPNFTGREAILNALREHFVDPSSSSRAQAIYGLGGVGKTQLAVEYASRHAWDERSYSHVLWLRAEEHSVLASDYAGLTETLGLLEQNEVEQHPKIEAVRRWLQQHEGWLLIFDNAEQPTNIQPFLPTSHRGHILITSRNPAWSDLATPRQVDILDRTDSIALIQKRTRRDENQAADALAQTLGDLPLALSQAAAYIEQTGRSIQEYLRLAEKRKQELLALPSAPIDYPSTVATTWSLSFEQVRNQCPPAADLLSLCSFLGASPIPIEILKRGAAALPASFSTIVSDEIQFDHAISTLRRYSLVHVSNQALLFHRLVQTVMSRLEKPGKAWAEAALRLIHGFFRFSSLDLNSWTRCAFLLPHALTVSAHSQELGIINDALLELLSHIASFWEEQAEYQHAHDLLSSACDLSHSLTGGSPLVQANILHLLGGVELRLGRALQAKTHLENALSAIQATPAGELRDESEVSATNDLAMVHFELDQLPRAEELAKQALSLSHSLLGQNDSQLGLTLGNLGLILTRQARLDEGREHIEHALFILSKIYGPTHPRVATLSNNLGNILRDQGHYEDAQKHFERALRDIESVHGSIHPNVASILRNIGDIYHRKEDFNQAKEYCLRALRIDEECLGPDHINVAIDLNELARVLHSQRQLETARTLFERALSIEERVFGKENGRVATTLDNLGRVQQELDDPEGARVSFERALKLTQQTYGSEHPRVANVLNNLSQLIGQHFGDYPQARRHLEMALAIDEKAYGRHHPEVAIDSCNLAAALMTLGEDFTYAMDLLKHAATICDSPSPPPPTNVALVFFHLGFLHVRLEQWKDAKGPLERALKIQEQAFPSNKDEQFSMTVALLSKTLHTLRESEQLLGHLYRALTFRRLYQHGPIILDILNQLRGALRDAGRIAELRSCLERVKKVASEESSTDALLLVSLELGRIYRDDGRPEEALANFDLAHLIHSKTSGLVKVSITALCKQRGELCLELRRWKSAEGIFASMLSLQLPIEKLSFVHCNLGISFLRQKNFKRALLHMKKALSLATSAHGANSLQHVNILCNVASVYEASGKKSQALKYLKQALNNAEHQKDPDANLISELRARIRSLSL